jgi:adenosylhomocysteine nucleosidase
LILASDSKDASPPLLVVTGMTKEMRIAAGPGVAAIGSGGNTARLRELLAALGGQRHRAVLSFGIAGGLSPELKPGAVLVATEVAGPERRCPVNSGTAHRLAERLRSNAVDVHLGTLAGVDAPLMSAAGKLALWQRTGAAAADMESHIAAEHAAANGLPFMALRVVCDPAERSLPPLAAKALRSDGRTDYPAILASLIRNPAQLPAMIQLARDASAAFRSLRRCGDFLGIGRGSADLVELLGDVA